MGLHGTDVSEFVSHADTFHSEDTHAGHFQPHHRRGQRPRRIGARFFLDIFEATEAPSWGVFTNIQLDEGVLLQFAVPPVTHIQMQHYAFLVDEELFDRAYGRIREREIPYAADPFWQRLEEINAEHGGRGVYFTDPAGHLLEMFSHPYL